MKGTASDIHSFVVPDIRELLRQHFGYDEFRPLQEEIIRTALAGQDCFVVMPTGGGKSLCYQLPTLAHGGLTLVVSPLIALMKDQVDGLNENGIPALSINSAMTVWEQQDAFARIRSGEVRIVYAAPERCTRSDFGALLRELPVRLIAIDEAHCVSEWGHEFRPHYRALSVLRQWLPGVPMIALTATATDRVRNDIITHLGLESARQFAASFNRPNLSYSIIPKKSAFEKICRILDSRRDASAIIYCFSRRNAEALAARLRANGISALPYHAGLSPSLRRETQEKFIRDEVPVIVATIAFGMGIDKPDVRIVIHADMPKSIEGYYQETGRAGRDGMPSECVLFYSGQDRTKHLFFINQIEDDHVRSRVRAQLDAMTALCESHVCRRAALLRYFGEAVADLTCGSCDTCREKDGRPWTSFFPHPRQTKMSREVDTQTPYDRALFERLRALRKSIADEKKVPPFVIFSDRSLIDMARTFPRTREAFSNIFGVGEQKLATLSDAFLQCIDEYISQKEAADGDDTTVSAL